MKIISSISIAILLAGVAGAANWSMYLRDPAHSSFNATETQLDRNSIQGVQTVWVFSAGAFVAAAATVSDGVLYFGDWAGNFHAVRATDGTELWSQFVGISAPPADPGCQPATGVTSQAVVIDNIVYVGGGDAAVYALDKTSGSRVWRVPIADTNAGAYIWSSITTSGGSLYLGVASLGDCPLVPGALVRIDLANPQTPRIRYLATEDDPGGGIWSTPAIDEETNTVYITTGTGNQEPDNGIWGGTLMALDGTTLETKAYYFLPTNSVDTDIEWGSSPTLFQSSDGRKMVGATGKDGILYALLRDDLSLVWTVEVAISCICPECGCGSLSTPAFDGKALYVGAGVRDPNSFTMGSIYSINPDSGGVLWVRDLDSTVIAPPTVANNLVYVSTTSGLAVFDAQTSESVWDDGGYNPLYSQTVVQDGVIYNTYLNGDVMARSLPDIKPAPPIFAAPRSAARGSWDYPD